MWHLKKPSFKTRSNKNTASNGRGGFTLPELLGILTILAIVAGIAIAGFRAFQAAANEKALTSNVQNINKGLRQFVDAGGTFSGAYSAGSKTADGTLPSSSASGMIDGLKSGVYVQGVMLQVQIGNYTAASYSVTTDSATGQPIIAAAGGAKTP